MINVPPPGEGSKVPSGLPPERGGAVKWISLLAGVLVFLTVVGFAIVYFVNGGEFPEGVQRLFDGPRGGLPEYQSVYNSFVG